LSGKTNSAGRGFVNDARSRADEEAEESSLENFEK
jgi:hypothetical protein